MPEINRKGYVVQEIRVVGRSGQRLAGFPSDVFSRITHGRFVSLPRGELAASIFAKIEGRGDAASCVSLLAGQGSALAMVGAYILAGELHRTDGDYAAAFARYQDLFGPFVHNKQKAALRFAATFAPKSKFALLLRNQIFKLMAIPWFADLAFGHDLADTIALPDYESTAHRIQSTVRQA